MIEYEIVFNGDVSQPDRGMLGIAVHEKRDPPTVHPEAGRWSANLRPVTEATALQLGKVRRALNDESWHTVKALAGRSRLSDRTVRKCLAILQAEGELDARRSELPGQKGIVPEWYRLVPWR